MSGRVTSHLLWLLASSGAQDVLLAVVTSDFVLLQRLGCSLHSEQHLAFSFSLNL